jgi:hypothetical protein
MDYKQLNKKGMLMRDYVIILVLFGVVAGIGGLIASDMSSSEYGYNITNIGALGGIGGVVTVNSAISMGNANAININNSTLNLYSGTIATNIGQSVGQVYFNNTAPFANSPSFSFALYKSTGFSSVLDLSPTAVAVTTPINMNNNNITGINTLQGNGATKISCSSDFYINIANTLYVSTIVPTGISNIQIAGGAYLTTNPPSNTNDTTIATTAWVNDAIIGNQVLFSSTTTNNDTIAPTTITFDQQYNSAAQTNTYTGTPVITTASATSSISFTINFPTPAWPAGTTPKFLTGTLVNLSDTNGVSFCCTTNFFSSGYNLGIQCNSQGNVLGSTTFTLTANINIGWT